MTGDHKRRTKHRHDSTSVVHMEDTDEGGSSHPNVTSGRTLRPRQRRAADNVARDVGGTTSSDEDDVEDSPFRVEPRHGKAPVQENSSENEEAAEGDDEEDEMHQEELSFPTIKEPIRFGRGRCVDYSASGMTREVKRWRKIDPYSLERTSTDPRFHTKE